MTTLEPGFLRGAFGRPLVHSLRTNQHEVCVLTRSPDSVSLKEVGAEPVIADALDAAAVKAVTQPPVAEPNHLTTSHAHWATVFAASSIAATVTSGCAIMLG
jgi:nucleoside-diphosphate-sugar epimerase